LTVVVFEFREGGCTEAEAIGVKVFIKKGLLDEKKRMILINKGLAYLMDEDTL
jgi:hypothetical protein